MTTALVLSAGGMFAAWEVGVWKALFGRLKPDLIVGASAGAWNGWAIAGGATPEELTREWMDPLTAKIMRRGLHRFGVLRPEILYQKSRELFSRFQPRLPFGLTVVEVPRMKPTLVRDAEITWQYLAATASIPFGFPPVEIRGARYVDGGLMGALPLWAAERMGATRAIAVNSLTMLPFRLLRKVLPPPRFSAALEVIHIEPSESLGSLRSATVWSESNIRRWIDLGERDGNRAATSITM
ncbi:MAG TPA: patatin-like phospholipase family protein [Bryobacteraceae bacterium]